MSALIRKHEGAFVFLVALGLRLLVGALVYGSVDLTNSISYSMQLNGGERVILPYIPLVPLIIWIGGALAATTTIPLGLCFKLVPIVCDSLLAWLLHEWLSRRAGRRWRFAGLLYALSPVPLIVASLHAQWDPIPLLFLTCALALRDSGEENSRRDLALGTMFGLACVAKPYPLMLAPVLLLPPLCRLREGRAAYVRSALRVCAATLAVLGVALGVTALVGFEMGRQLQAIVNYSNDSIQIFGLPFAPGFAKFGFLRQHAWTLPFIVGLAAPYHLGRWPSVRVAAAAFVFVLGVSGLGPQYLMWPTAFLLASGLFWEAGAVGLLGTVFLTLYYMNPNAPFAAWENMATFATLKSATWLMPTPDFADPGDLSLIRTLGNVVLPTFFLVTLARLFLTAHQEKKAPLKPLSLSFVGTVALTVLVFIGALAAAGAIKTSGMTSNDFHGRLQLRLASYAIQVGGPTQQSLIGRYDQGGPICLPRLLVALAALTGAGCVAAGLRRPLSSPRS